MRFKFFCINFCKMCIILKTYFNNDSFDVVITIFSFLLLDMFANVDYIFTNNEKKTMMVKKLFKYLKEND